MLTALQAQHSMNQNELARYQLSSARRADSEAEQMRALFGGATPTSMTDPEFIRKIYAVNPKEGMALEKANAERTKFGVDLANTRSQTAEREIKIRTAKADAFAARLAPLAAGLAEGKTVTHDDVFTVMRGLIDEGLATQQDMQHIPQKADEIPAFVKRLVSANDNARKALAFYQPDPLVAGGDILNRNPNAPGGIMAQLGKVNAPPSTAAAMLSAQGATTKWNPETLRFENVATVGAPTRAPNALIPRPAAMPETVGGPSPREMREARAKGYIFNADGTMTRIPGGPADKAGVDRTPVQETKFKKDLATDFATVTATTQGMQDVLDSIADVRKSDISGATGLQSYLPTFPSGPTAKAETNLANLKGKLTSLGQTIANQSGKIGPMAVQEWTIVRDMVSALDTAVKSGETITRDELEKIEFTAKNVAERLKSKFEGQYGDELPNYPSFAVIPEPKSRLGSAAPAKPQAPAAALSPIDQQALDWANTNKKDPRAAAIHLRLGR